MVHLFCRENNWGGQRHSSFSILVFAIKRKRKGGGGLFLPRVSLFLIILGNARWQVGKCFYEGFFFLPFFSLSFSPFFRIHFAILSSRIQRELVENFNTFVERIVGNSSHPCRALFWIEQWFWYSINFYNCIDTFCAHLAILFLSNICKKKKMINILVIESRRIYSNSVFHFLTSTGVLIVRHACRGIRSMGRRKVEINCAPRDALSLFTCFYVFSFSEYFTMCRKFDADASRYASFVSRFR